MALRGWSTSRKAASGPKRPRRAKKGSMPPTHASSEHAHQAAFIAAIRRVNHPAARLTMAIPNGFMRSKSMRLRAWKEGLLSGVADLLVPVAMGGFHGLWIEMKSGSNDMTPEQVWFKGAVEAQGYRHEVCRSWDEALRVWCQYLDLELRIQR